MKQKLTRGGVKVNKNKEMFILLFYFQPLHHLAGQTHRGDIMKVYVVTKGEDYDYHIITATTDKDLANKIAEKFNDEYNETRIEEFENAERTLLPFYCVEFDFVGDVQDIHTCNYVPTDTYWDGYRGLTFYVQADDESDAVIIAKRHRIEYLEEKEKRKVVDLVNRLKKTNYCPLDYDELLGEKTDKYMYIDDKKWCENIYSEACKTTTPCWEKYLGIRISEIEHKFALMRKELEQ